MAFDVEVEESVEIHTLFSLMFDELFVAEESQIRIVDLDKTPMLVSEGKAVCALLEPIATDIEKINLQSVVI